jgi:hypothetical protein
LIKRGQSGFVHTADSRFAYYAVHQYGNYNSFENKGFYRNENQIENIDVLQQRKRDAEKQASLNGYQIGITPETFRYRQEYQRESKKQYE